MESKFQVGHRVRVTKKPSPEWAGKETPVGFEFTIGDIRTELSLGVECAFEMRGSCYFRIEDIEHVWREVGRNETHVMWEATNGAQLAKPIGDPPFSHPDPTNMHDCRCTLGRRGIIVSSCCGKSATDDYVPFDWTEVDRNETHILWRFRDGTECVRVLDDCNPNVDVPNTSGNPPGTILLGERGYRNTRNGHVPHCGYLPRAAPAKPQEKPTPVTADRYADHREKYPEVFTRQHMDASDEFMGRRRDLLTALAAEHAQAAQKSGILHPLDMKRRARSRR